jgi:hypothetical protein
MGEAHRIFLLLGYKKLSEVFIMEYEFFPLSSLSVFSIETKNPKLNWG